MNSDSYRLAAILNVYNNEEDFVYPVFEKNGIYYLENSKNNIIHSFTELNLKNVIKKMTSIKPNNSKFLGANEYYNIGDEKPYTFQMAKNVIVICDLQNFIRFLKSFRTRELILRAVINNFVAQNKKYLVKKETEKIL